MKILVAVFFISTALLSSFAKDIVKRGRLLQVEPKLNPLLTKWPKELALFFCLCSVKRMRVFESPWMGH